VNPSSQVPSRFLIDLQPIGRRIEVDAGTDLLTAAQKAGVDLVAACGGVGICGTCRVRIASGKLSPLTLNEEAELRPEEITQGWRMACQAVPFSDVRLEIPPESLPVAQKMQVDGRESEFELDPNVVALELELAAPTIEDLRADLTRASQAVTAAGYPTLHGDLGLLDTLSHGLRHHRWSARLALRPQSQVSDLVAVLPPGTPLLGLAVDLGSTKLAVYLVELASGATLAKTGVMNPQISYGEDVVSRIAFANKSIDNRRTLQTRLVETLNGVLDEFCAQLGVNHNQIVDAVVVGNTAMHHFFCGLPVEQLGAAPYVAAVSQPLDVRAAELGLKMAPGAWVHLPANIAGYVGGDHTAVLLTTQGYAAKQTLVAVDIGTNTEISVIHNGKIVSCSTASGPAFEGAHIRDGMRAATGAIERVRITNGEVHVTTIGGLAPIGICGSGILWAISEMLEAGIVDERGALRKDAPGVRTTPSTSGASNGNKAEFVLSPAAKSGHGRDVVVTRSDINEIQLAKGAIRAGIEILLHEMGLDPLQVDAWIIAGAFGTYLDIGSALKLGMFPRVPLERFHQVGNAAGVGAKQMLLSRQKRLEANRLVEQVSYVELTIYPQFTQEFVKAMYLKS
jgi:uncharacterized 2Fe-2S/4Fe-4S cluster protein (DUF4445 family)